MNDIWVLCYCYSAAVLHHMVPGNGIDFPLFQKKLTDLKIILEQLIANKSRIIWKTQAPTPWLAHESDAKVPHYNDEVRNIFK